MQSKFKKVMDLRIQNKSQKRCTQKQDKVSGYVYGWNNSSSEELFIFMIKHFFKLEYAAL
jgi:hypothetical protein